MKRLALWVVVGSLAAPVGAQPALRIVAGSVAHGEVVALGRDLVVEGQVASDVAVISGDARIDGLVTGDVIVLGGSARLGPTARVDGDVFAVGGEISTSSGASVGGRAVAYPSLGAAWLTLIEGPSLGLSAGSRIVLAAKLALLTAWLALAVGLLAASGRSVLASSELVKVAPLRSFLTGLTGILALFMIALAVTTFVPGVAGAPLVALLVLFALLLKLWGVVAVFHALGDWLSRVLFKRRLEPLNAATVGLLVLGAIKLVPWAGTLVWWAATFVGVGVALATKFGRREAWIEPAASGELAGIRA
jgi:cytoskeletal protein CcmA (bactofilin family)